MRQIRRYNTSGEQFACDPESMLMSAMLHHSELNEPLENYQLDSDMDQSDLDDSLVVREETTTIQQWMTRNEIGDLQSPCTIEPDTEIRGPIGTCQDGINRADVYRLETGEYLIDAQAATVVQEDDPRLRYNSATVVRDDLGMTIHVGVEAVEAADAADARQQISELRRDLAIIQAEMDAATEPWPLWLDKDKAWIEQQIILLEDWAAVTDDEIWSAKYRDPLLALKQQIVDSYGSDRQHHERARLLSVLNSAMERAQFQNLDAEKQYWADIATRERNCAHHEWTMTDHDERECRNCGAIECVPDF